MDELNKSESLTKPDSVITWHSQNGKETPLAELPTAHLRNIVNKLLRGYDGAERVLYQEAQELGNKGLAKQMHAEDLHLFILLGHLAERQLWINKKEAIQLTEEEKQEIANRAIEAEVARRKSEVRQKFHIASQLG